MKLIYMENYNPNALYIWSGNRMAMVMLLKDNNIPKVLCLWSTYNKNEINSLKACFIRGFFKPGKLDDDSNNYPNYGNIAKEVAEDSGFPRLLEKLDVCDKKMDWEQKMGARIEKLDFRNLMEFATKKAKLNRPKFELSMEKWSSDDLDKVAGAMADYFDEFISLRKLDKVI